MNQRAHNSPNIVKAIFLGKQTRLLQAHIDFLLMTALILGFYAARIPLHWSVRWAMVIGAFGNSSIFLLESIFPVLESADPADGSLLAIFQFYAMGSISTTTYDSGRRHSPSCGRHSALTLAPIFSRNDDRPNVQGAALTAPAMCSLGHYSVVYSRAASARSFV